MARSERFARFETFCYAKWASKRKIVRLRRQSCEHLCPSRLADSQTSADCFPLILRCQRDLPAEQCPHRKSFKRHEGRKRICGSFVGTYNKNARRRQRNQPSSISCAKATGTWLPTAWARRVLRRAAALSCCPAMSERCRSWRATSTDSRRKTVTSHASSTDANAYRQSGILRLATGYLGAA
jgi:hypothetical protein